MTEGFFLSILSDLGNSYRLQSLLVSLFTLIYQQMQAEIKINDLTYSTEQFFALEKLPIDSLTITSLTVTGGINNPFKIDNAFTEHFQHSCCKTQQGYVQPPTYLSDLHFQNCYFDIASYGIQRLTNNACSIDIVSCNLTEDQLTELSYQVSPYLLGELNLQKNLLGKNPEKLKQIFKQFYDSQFRFTADLSQNYVDSSLIEQLRQICPGLSFIQ